MFFAIFDFFWKFIKNMGQKLGSNSVDDRKSKCGYLVFFGQIPISWKSGKQRVVASSSIEAKYKALDDGTVEVIWLQYLLTDL